MRSTLWAPRTLSRRLISKLRNQPRPSIAELFFNALLAALVAVLPDQVPTAQRGLVCGVLGVCVPIASVSATVLVKLFTGNELAMFLVPCAVGGFFILVFAATLKDRRVAQADRPTWSLREFAGTFYVDPRRNPDFAWPFLSRFMFLLAYAFLTTYQRLPDVSGRCGARRSVRPARRA
jgi:hypothetical protein